MDRRPVLLSGAEHDQVAGVVAGRTEQQPGNPSAAVAVGDAGHDHDSAHACSQRALGVRSAPSTTPSAGALNGDSSVMAVLFAVDPRAADVEVGLAGAGERLDRRIDHRGVQIGAGLVTGTGRVDGPVRVAEQAHDRGPVVEVDHTGVAPRCGDDIGLGVVADERGHLVAVLPQLREDVRPDESCCPGERDLHGCASFSHIRSSACLRILAARNLSSDRLNGQPVSCACRGRLRQAPEPARARSASRTCLWSSAPTGASASQFNIPATQRVRKINSRSLTPGTFAFSTDRTSARIRSNLASNRCHPSWRVDPGPRDDPHHVKVATPGRQRAHHRPGEGRRQFLER